MQLTQKSFAKSNLLIVRSIWAKKVLNLPESSIFYAPLKVALEVLHDRVLGSLGAAVADDVYPGNKHNGASVSSLYFLEKMERKTNRSNIFCE